MRESGGTNERLLRRVRVLSDDLKWTQARLLEEPLNAGRCVSLEEMFRAILGAKTVKACHAIAHDAIEEREECPKN